MVFGLVRRARQTFLFVAYFFFFFGFLEGYPDNVCPPPWMIHTEGVVEYCFFCSMRKRKSKLTDKQALEHDGRKERGKLKRQKKREWKKYKIENFE